MPNAPKSLAPAGVPKALPFEEALKKLESIVEQMEGGELPLETMMARFEEGLSLVKNCQTRLEDAELKISKVEKSATAEPVLKPISKSLTEDE